MRRFWACAAAAAAMATMGGAAEAGERAAVSVNAGTLGVGGDVQIRAHHFLVLRAGGHFLDFGVDDTFDGVNYDIDVGGSNAFLTADIHPMRNGFFLSAGVVYGDKTVDLLATPEAFLEIGNIVVTQEQVGELTGAAELREAAPFFGLGYDSALYHPGRFGFSVMLGAALTGEPDFALSSEGGTLSDDPLFLEQLAIEEENVRESIDDFSVYPVARVGFSVSF